MCVCVFFCLLIWYPAWCYDQKGNGYGVFDSGPDGVDNWYRIIITYRAQRGLYETVPDEDLACSTGDISITNLRKGYIGYRENSWEIDLVGECSQYVPAQVSLKQWGNSNTWTYKWYNPWTGNLQHEAQVKFRPLKHCRN